MSWRVLAELEYEGSKYLALVPAEDNGEEDLEVSILKAVDENGEEILVTIDDDDELEAVYGALMDLIYEDEDAEETRRELSAAKNMSCFPAGCVTAPLKPTLYSGDAGKLPVSIAGLPPTALTGGGRWKQRSIGEATHLPFRAGYNWSRTAFAGIRFACRYCADFLYGETGQGTNALPPLFYIIVSRSSREASHKLPASLLPSSRPMTSVFPLEVRTIYSFAFV